MSKSPGSSTAKRPAASLATKGIPSRGQRPRRRKRYPVRLRCGYTVWHNVQSAWYLRAKEGSARALAHRKMATAIAAAGRRVHSKKRIGCISFQVRGDRGGTGHGIVKGM